MLFFAIAQQQQHQPNFLLLQLQQNSTTQPLVQGSSFQQQP